MLLQPEPQSDIPWYVLYTIPNNEKKVYSELVKRSVDAFLPLQKVVRQWGHRKKNLEVPLFPNYLFVHITKKELWSLLSISGVMKFVTFNGTPAKVKSSEVEIIKKIILLNGEVTTQHICTVGEKVRVMQGPFAGLEGKVVEINGKTRLVVKFETINTVVSVDASALRMEKELAC